MAVVVDAAARKGAIVEEAAPSLSVGLMDLVRLKPEEADGDNHGDLGLVVEAPSVNFPDVPAGTFTVLCVDGALMDKVDNDLVAIVDRSSLHPGQRVVSASDPAGQVGVVTAVATKLDLADLNAGAALPIMRGVSAAAVRRARALSLGDYVLSGSWLGRVVEVAIDIDVLFDDGAMCRITDAGTNLRVMDKDTSVNHRPQMNSRLYTGQRVTIKDSRARAYSKRRHKEGTVAKLEMTGVVVYWLASAEIGTGKDGILASAPPAYQNPDDLTFFCSDSYCTWGLADHCVPIPITRHHRRRRRRPTPTDDSSNSNFATDNKQDEVPPATTLTALQVDDQEPPPAAGVLPSANEEKPYRNQLRKFFFRGYGRTARRGGRRTRKVERTMTVVGTRTTADVLWQDGTRQREVPSVALIPLAGRHEFFPGERVVLDNAAAPMAEVATVGFVKGVNCKDQTVRVAWLNPAMAGAYHDDETVSAYDLRRDTDHSVIYGDVVIRLPQPEETGSGGSKATSADLSWVGRVVDVRGGHVEIIWGDGETTTVLPHEVAVVDGRYFLDLSYEMGPWFVDVESETRSRRATNNNGGKNAGNGRATRGSAAGGSGGGASNASAPETTMIGRVGASVLAVIGFASQVFVRGKSYMVSGSSWSSSSSSGLPAATGNAKADDRNSDVTENAAAHKGDDRNSDVTENTAAYKGKKKKKKKMKMDADAGGDGLFCFPHFDVVQSPADHHYLDATRQDTNPGSKWVKKVQKEWKILKNNLPDTMYVRVYEDRMDLLRAAIVGARGTPYDNGLFLFDVHLPPSYPAVPPQVYYHSFGMRVNPNLYSDGTVCLSLLNTFGGEGTEVWSPAASTLLQIVVSIQGLVLTDEPYYNEAGYEALVGTPEGQRNALPYGENARLLTLRSGLHLLRRPPAGLEELVRGHFRHCGKLVLAACLAYLRGGADAGDTERTTCSPGFRLALANVVPGLVKSFAEIGAEGCDLLVDELRRCPQQALGTMYP